MSDASRIAEEQLRRMRGTTAMQQWRFNADVWLRLVGVLDAAFPIE